MKQYKGKVTVLLDRYIETEQIKNFRNNLDKSQKKKTKKILKDILILLFGPLLMGIGAIVFSSTLLFLLGGSITILSFLVFEVKDVISDFKLLSKEEAKLNVYTELSETLEPGQVLNNKCTMKKGKDFFSSMAREQLSTVDSEETRKYREALIKQQRELSQEVKPLGVSETKFYISEEIHKYGLIYDLPPLEIDEQVWDSLFSSVYQVFVSKGDISGYYDYMADLSRSVCAKALINNSESIEIGNFLKEIYSGYGVTVQDIETIKRKVSMRLHTKVLDINDLRKNKH